ACSHPYRPHLPAGAKRRRLAGRGGGLLSGGKSCGGPSRCGPLRAWHWRRLGMVSRRSQRRILPARASTSVGVIAAALVSPAMPAASRPIAAKPQACPTAGTRVVSFGKAVDGGGFLTSEGEEVRLAGIIAIGKGGDSPSPAALSAARNALADALRDRTI